MIWEPDECSGKVGPLSSQEGNRKEVGEKGQKMWGEEEEEAMARRGRWEQDAFPRGIFLNQPVV